MGRHPGGGVVAGTLGDTGSVALKEVSPPRAAVGVAVFVLLGNDGVGVPVGVAGGAVPVRVGETVRVGVARAGVVDGAGGAVAVGVGTARVLATILAICPRVALAVGRK